MKDLLNETNRDKYLFKSYYCAGCKQTKPCGKLTNYTEQKNYCCPCYYRQKQEQAQEYLTYESTLATKQRERQETLIELKQLRI